VVIGVQRELVRVERPLGLRRRPNELVGESSGNRERGGAESEALEKPPAGEGRFDRFHDSSLFRDYSCRSQRGTLLFLPGRAAVETTEGGAAGTSRGSGQHVMACRKPASRSLCPAAGSAGTTGPPYCLH